jgi:geranylgeranyl pyrophosphate synthase
MGAIVGGGSEEQVEAVGMYFEQLGLAFQIMDDVLNLRGLFTNEADLRRGVALKKVGEDITAGKVTMPIVKGMGLLPEADRRNMWEIVSTCPEDPDVVAGVIETLERCGALDACVDQATRLVEDSWVELDRVCPDSFQKLMLRSFGWFVIERTH